MKLALEFSQREATIAASLEGKVAVRSVSMGGRQEHDDLWPMIQEATEEIGGEPSFLNDVIVNAGPGGFTGVRTAIATAAMLGRLGSQVLALPAHLAVAEASLEHGDPDTSIVLAVKNQRAWIGTVRWQDGLWTTLVSPQDEDLDAFFAKHNPARVVADEHLPERFQSVCEIIPLRTSAHALLQRLAKDPSRTPLDELRPIYPRVPEAVRVWEERHAGP
ncbi:MAG: tRNA (adenosine(37)-N6)-threonylcarbamoyltransferase complex dimerization subunit type 1 TsaB [Planctomycetota bacterium]|nr:tRNA (adenosine(37)-N6)-threonylcarbamoyltransferase complex dimerization subunit type 1 TsaB [Planctomycetota bacterium]MEC8251168.1 tRNA (adenosine(37)-N6)-threonylcarbamoyltransferase complex dimerization subunit type 1 TsaB [Planctomycetota bacterium]MEC8386130.1 tRNA (adenosine(37)-N6)-threonylcarbamoyltransferase complex dimerization subunit type 1 TsaB [Planctomycetota bacterium]